MSLTNLFDKWVQLTEVDPNGNVIKSSEIDIHEYNNKLRKALKYEGDERDVVILLNEFLIQFLHSRCISLYDIYNNDKNIYTKISQIEEIKKDDWRIWYKYILWWNS